MYDSIASCCLKTQAQLVSRPTQMHVICRTVKWLVNKI